MLLVPLSRGGQKTLQAKPTLGVNTVVWEPHAPILKHNNTLSPETIIYKNEESTLDLVLGVQFFTTTSCLSLDPNSLSPLQERWELHNSELLTVHIAPNGRVTACTVASTPYTARSLRGWTTASECSVVLNSPKAEYQQLPVDGTCIFYTSAAPC